LAYLPGFFSANMRQGPTVVSRVTHESSQTILASLESDTLDIGVLLPPARLSPRLRIPHRFRDAFTFIANADQLTEAKVNQRSRQNLGRWIESQPWLALQDTTQNCRRLHRMAEGREAASQTRHGVGQLRFDHQLGGRGSRCSLVPQRSLALYARRHAIVRLPGRNALCVNWLWWFDGKRQTPEHIQRFVENILSRYESEANVSKIIENK